MAIVLGRSQVGKSTLINKLRGMKMEANDNGDLVVKTKLEKTAQMGSGVAAQTKIAEVYEWDKDILLLDTRGFLGGEVDVKEEIINSLILQFFQRNASKVMIVYISQYENYHNLTNAYDDMKCINEILKNKELPVVFVANKCNEFWLHKMQIQHKETSEIIEKVQGSLIGKFTVLEKTTVDKIEKKFPEIKAAQSLEQKIGILLQKAKGATGVQGEEIRRSLNQLQTLLVWKKAHANGRLIYYDPTLDGSEEPIKDEINNLDNYRSPNDVSLDQCNSYHWFMEFASSMASKLYWLVLAMRGRKQIPDFQPQIFSACEDFAKDSEKLYSEVSDDVEELEDKLRNITFESEESIVTTIKNQENTIKQCNDDIVEYQKRINELDQPETVKFDTIEFCEFDNYASNEVVIERPINVPNATCFFTAGNKYTYNDKEEQEVCIKDGVLRGVFKAPKALRRALNVVGAVMGFGIPTAFLNDSSVCEGKIDLFAPKRDIPSNRQKIQEYQIKVKECENRKEECGISIDTLKRELDMVQKRNDRKKDEINTNEKKKRDMEERIEYLKNEEEKWINRSSRLQKCLEFCRECDEQWENNYKIIEQMYLFAKLHVSKIPNEKTEWTTKKEKSFETSSSSNKFEAGIDSMFATKTKGTNMKDEKISSSFPMFTFKKLFDKWRMIPANETTYRSNTNVHCSDSNEKKKDQKMSSAFQGYDEHSSPRNEERSLTVAEKIKLYSSKPNSTARTTQRNNVTSQRKSNEQKGAYDSTASSSVSPDCLSNSQLSDQSAHLEHQFKHFEEFSVSMECKYRGKEKHIESQPENIDENTKIIMKFIIAKEKMEEIPKLIKDFELMDDGKVSKSLVKSAADSIEGIWNKMFEYKGFLEEFKKMKLSI
ncbi:uncharacterized protein MONOS_16588 [Monocercomonoides exilis]|uniref:uncharacterized protein n=1 Tax=Monocercomonoides exilis TaxID=2049356 RepID=UPI00355A6076|nr:hypothetical protein MONOS_16588 [Monocercomonoides exilis]|eukprot:MONOS_16588.1-p1 / transcript=MONOS_16588.1 / gene=MONOS_16588 / organism=Monocercomonoides_exilis_PA203 / gene_product=unspecified product / transcript_product=unspecified product / location=Mono_scaffold01888:96-2747(+) / protein_length=883 / sequence_SO=supercontig / SO=protein_coding / is_pseudo=false